MTVSRLLSSGWLRHFCSSLPSTSTGIYYPGSTCFHISSSASGKVSTKDVMNYSFSAFNPKQRSGEKLLANKRSKNGASTGFNLWNRRHLESMLCHHRNISPTIFISTSSFHSSALLNAKGKSSKLSKGELKKLTKAPLATRHKSKRPGVKAYKGITIRDLAKSMEKDPDDIFLAIMQTDFADMYTHPTERITSQQLLTTIIRLCGFNLDLIRPPKKLIDDVMEVEVDKDQYPRSKPDPENCVPRPPVVTIMGHVDHGKTTLLDALRNSQIVATEFGGITQHIGAFRVKLPNQDATITFLDTPGHAAFHAMRQRGANATDIVILVVAADDGVMDQTLESIKFARIAKVPIVVAINKCDKPKANPDRTREMLMTHGIITEEHGGDVQSICVSALQKTNLNALQEAVLTEAEVMDLKGDPNGDVEGIVIESKSAHGRGKICTALVQRGTLKKGAYLVAGESWCKVRSLNDENGLIVKSAPPSWPVEVSGWKENLPSAGDVVLEVPTEARAKEVVAWRRSKAMEKKALEDLKEIEERREVDRKVYEESKEFRLSKGFRRRYRLKDYKKPKQAYDLMDPSIVRFPILIKADVDGSLDAILTVLETFESEYCSLDLVDFGVGQLTESDIETIAPFNGKVYLFNTDLHSTATELAKEKSIPVKNFNVIYHMIADLKVELENAMPTYEEKEILGSGYVLKEFLISVKKVRDHPVAGCLVKTGVFSKTARVLIRRGDTVILDDFCSSMRVEKDIVKDAIAGQEVGIMFDDPKIRFEPDDVVEFYQIKDVRRPLNWNPPGF